MGSSGLNRSTKVVLYGAGALAVVAGPVLFFFPDDTGSYFAWKIGNSLTPNFMGANYLAGAGAVWAALINRWSVARVIMPAIVTFGLTQLIATLMHLDILKWDHPTAWAWLIVYIVSPIGAIWVAVAEERRWRPESGEGRPMAPVPRLLFAVFGTASAAIGAALFIVPTHVGDVWPWALTPLTGRVIGGWYLSGAALQLMLARTRSVTVARVGLLATTAVTALQLLGALLNHDHFTGPAWAVALYLGYSVILGATALAASLPTHQQKVAVAA